MLARMPSQARIGTPTPDMLHEFLVFAQKCLPSYAVPQYIRTMQQVPITGTMKLRKGVLKKEGLSCEDPVFELRDGKYIRLLQQARL